MVSSASKKIALLLTSTREIRIGPEVIKIIQKHIEQAQGYTSIELAVIDLKDFDLPLYNEIAVPAMVPAYAQYSHAHSKRWSEAIAPYDGYIFVSAEYNFGVPAAAKNAIDYLYNEWIGKPILIIGYGIHGGVNSIRALKTTFEGMHLRVARTRPELAFVGGGRGQDTMTATTTGKVGDATREAWEGEGKVKEDLVTGFEELLKMVNDPEIKGSEADAASQ